MPTVLSDTVPSVCPGVAGDAVAVEAAVAVDTVGTTAVAAADAVGDVVVVF